MSQQMDDVCKTIYEHLNRKPRNEMFPLLPALSAKNMQYSNSESFLKFKFADPDNKGLNTVIVKYNKETDLYDVEFWNCKILKKDPYIINDHIKTIDGIYAENLTQIVWGECVTV